MEGGGLVEGLAMAFRRLSQKRSAIIRTGWTHHRISPAPMSNPGGATISAEQLKARYVGTGECFCVLDVATLLLLC
jgi:hypothetical protein